MKKDVKKIFTLAEDVAAVKAAMEDRGWNRARLTRESGASSRGVTCFFQDGGLNAENTFKILHTLDLLKYGHTHAHCPFCSDIDPKIKDACHALDEMLKSQNKSVQMLGDSILKSIGSYRESKKKKFAASSGSKKRKLTNKSAT